MRTVDTVDTEECAICSRGRETGFVNLPCVHEFCTDCTIKWLSSNPTCPYCRHHCYRSAGGPNLERIVEIESDMLSSGDVEAMGSTKALSRQVAVERDRFLRYGKEESNAWCLQILNLNVTINKHLLVAATTVAA